MKKSKLSKKKLKSKHPLLHSHALYTVLSFLQLQQVSQYQILNKRFYNTILPQYINLLPIKRQTCFYRFVYSRKKVQIFNLYTLSWSSKTLDKSGWNNLVDNCQVIQTEKCRVFLIGGFYSNNQYSTKVSEYIVKDNTLVERASFSVPRIGFALCSIMGSVIYSVGGQVRVEVEDKTAMSATTEKYYIEDDEWDTLIPKLNEAKTGVSLCKFQNSYLYAFGGDNGRQKHNIVSDIERLDLLQEDDPEIKYWD